MQSKKLKGQLADMPNAALYVVILTIVVAMGVLILVGMNDSTTDSDASEILGEGITGLGVFGDWFSTIVLVVIAVVILGLVMTFFLLRKRGGRA